MIKYISETRDELKGLKNGMEGNPSTWQNQPDTPAMIQAKIEQLDTMEQGK